MLYCRECCGSGTDYKNNGDPDERRWDCPHCQGTGLEPTPPAEGEGPVWCDAEPVRPKYRMMRMCSHCGTQRPNGTPCPKCDPPVVHQCPHGWCKWCKRAMPTMFIEGHEAECQARPDTKVKTITQGE